MRGGVVKRERRVDGGCSRLEKAQRKGLLGAASLGRVRVESVRLGNRPVLRLKHPRSVGRVKCKLYINDAFWWLRAFHPIPVKSLREDQNRHSITC